MAREGRLLVVEGVIPPGNDPSFGKLLDLTMLTIPGGKERTEQEYRTLYRRRLSPDADRADEGRGQRDRREATVRRVRSWLLGKQRFFITSMPVGSWRRHTETATRCTTFRLLPENQAGRSDPNNLGRWVR